MTVAPPEHRPHRRRSRRKGPGRSAIVVVGALAIVIAASVIAFGGGNATDQFAGTSPSVSPSPGLSPTATLPAVATATPSVSASPTPTGIVARRIRIARLEIDLRVVEGDGVDAPLNKAAHYPGSGWPGGGTNIYIYAHARKGMFLALWNARVDDEIVLDLADGTSRTYVVTSVRPEVPWNALEYLAATPSEQLTLQTSTSYTATAPRFVVIAEPTP